MDRAIIAAAITSALEFVVAVLALFGIPVGLIRLAAVPHALPAAVGAAFAAFAIWYVVRLFNVLSEVRTKHSGTNPDPERP